MTEYMGKMNPHNKLVWKMRGPKFCEFLQPVGLKDWCSIGEQVWLVESPEALGLLLERNQGKLPVDIQHGKTICGVTAAPTGEVICLFKRLSRRGNTE